MKRKSFLIDQNKHSTTLIMVDSQNAKVIMPYIMQDKVDVEFKEIRQLLKENLKNSEKYTKAGFSNKAKDMFEMRFTRNQRNDRIYCKEISFCGKRFIVMIELLEGKKTQKIDNSTKARIETMGSYEYELEY